MMNDFIHSIALAHTKAAMKLKSEAARLYLSYLWWILEPMLYVAVFYFVFAYVLQNGRVDFLVFLMCGKIPLMWYTKTLNKNAAALTAGKGLMGQRDFPKHVFIYAASLEATYRELVVYGFLLLFLWWSGFEPQLTWLYLLFITPVMILLILSTGMVAGYVTVFVPDLRMVIAMISMALLFVSGVFWDVRALPNQEVAELILLYNPFAFLLDAHRQVLMYGNAPDLLHLAAIAIIASLLLAIMHVVYKVQSQFIAKQLFS